MSHNYDNYKEDVTQDIKKCLEEMMCLPILFVGSGVSRRYIGAPNWEELLKETAKNCPRIEKGFAYYKQNARKKNSKDQLIEIGTTFAELYHDWAWNEGKSEFPEELFEEDKPSEIYIKYKIAEYLNSLLTESFEDGENLEIIEEIQCLKKIRPHAIITTNYDLFLERIFTGYEPIVGHQILRTNFTSYGEILKIHGCVSDPQSMVLTTEDYKNFDRKKKYLTAKLLTYFAEHPLVFIGYSAEDPDIKSILSDVDEIISSQNILIPNIYILEWDPHLDYSKYPQREKIIPINSQKNILIKSITASSFKWVFEAFGTLCDIKNVDTKLLRALVARIYEFVRTDIPRNKVELNYQNLEHAVNNEDGLVTLFGLTAINDPSAFNAFYPYTLTAVGEKLGFFNKNNKGSWQKADDLIKQIKEEKGIDIKASDNIYHSKIKSGKDSVVNKYSDEAISLLRKVMDKVDYSLNTN